MKIPIICGLFGKYHNNTAINIIKVGLLSSPTDQNVVKPIISLPFGDGSYPQKC